MPLDADPDAHDPFGGNDPHHDPIKLSAAARAALAALYEHVHESGTCIDCAIAHLVITIAANGKHVDATREQMHMAIEIGLDIAEAMAARDNDRPAAEGAPL